MGLFQDIKDFLSGGSSKSSSTTVDQPKGGRGSENLYSKPKNTALQDLQMDLGIIEKNDVYYRDLAERQERSKAAMEQAMKSSDDDKPSVAAEEEVVEETAAAETTTPVEDVTSEIQEVADVVTKKKPQTKSTGPAEDKAREFEKKGRKSTVLTSMQGLDEEVPMTAEELKKLRSRRSLLAG